MIVAYCFIGKLPEYAIDTVYQTRLFYDGPIYFIISDIESIYVNELKLHNVTIVDYKDVKYSEFNNCIDKNIHRFEYIPNLVGREKLFIYSFERFAVLYKTMLLYNLSDVFFLELDNLIYDNPLKWESEFSKKRMAYMYEKVERCSSGICYIKDSNILCNFLDYCMFFIETTNTHLNEMLALYNFWELNKEYVQILPTHWLSNGSIISENYNNYQSVFDSASIGIYLGGLDPYHTQGVIVKNVKWWASEIDYTPYKYKWEKDDKGRNIPYVYNNTWLRINNLHIHSKDLVSNLSISKNVNITHIKKQIQILTLPEFQILPVMKCIFSELSGAFTDYDCTFKEVRLFSELEDGGIIFLHDEAGCYLKNKELYNRIAEKCPNSIFICWYWTDVTFQPFKKMLYTGEYFIYLEDKKNEIDRYDYFKHPKFVPLKLRANDHPSLIGTYKRNVVRDYCFMGGGYLMDWVPHDFSGVYHRVIFDNHLSYDVRRSIYLSSMFAFGFQNDENIQTGHLSQRIFEGMAYGCIVLCNNKLASDFTDGIVVYVSSKEDLVEKMIYYKMHSEEVEKKQKEGYEWVKKYGTNRISAELYLNKIKEEFKEEFNEIFEVKPVVSVTIKGGLGNQLFQIATAYAYSKKNNGKLEVFHTLENGNRSVYWDTVCQGIKPFLVSSIKQDLEVWHEELPTMYKDIGTLSMPGKEIDGYVQTSKYFAEYKDELKTLFTSDKDTYNAISIKYDFLLKHKDRVIIVHSRQTDYVAVKDFHGPLTYDYYRKAIIRMNNYISDPIYLLCGDDNTFWLNASLPFNGSCMIINESDIHTFALLHQFNNFIMSNSTYIWWCVWLADAKNVIVPAKWFGPNGPSLYEDIYEDTWERL